MSVTFADVQSAAERIVNYIHRTPVITSEQINALSGTQLFFKCENFQKVGAFKARGGVNAIFSRELSQLRGGVATHSSGNHGAALARAAALRNVPAHIAVPRDAKKAKLNAIRGYGGNVVLCEPTLEAREAQLATVVSETGALVVHPYDDEHIIAGQGTATLELVEQVSGLDAIITPIGGGGLLAGSCLVANENDIEIFGAEPTGADDAYRSLKTGNLVTSHIPDTICDGLLTTLGVRNFEIIKEGVREVLLVSDDETIAAMELIWTRMKLVVEPSSAVTLAAVIRYPQFFVGRKVGVVLTGGNVDLADLPFRN